MKQQPSVRALNPKTSVAQAGRTAPRPASVFGRNALLSLAAGLALAATQANTPPELGELAPVILLEDHPASVAVRVADAESPPEALRLWAGSAEVISSRIRLVRVDIYGTGPERLLHFVPYPNTNGFETLELVLSDPAGATARRQFPLHILPVNDPPEVDALPALRLVPGSQHTATVGVRDSDTPRSRLELAVEVSNPEMRPWVHFANGRFPNEGQVLINLPATARGSGVVTLRVADGEFTTSTSFLLEVTEPVFALGGTVAGSPSAALDLDADGALDWYFPTPGLTGFVRLARPAVPAQSEVRLPSDFKALTWGDFDGDGDLDALGEGYAERGRELRLLRTEPGVSNQVQLLLATNARPALGLARLGTGLTADLDQDGDLDAILFTSPTNGAYRMVLRNDGPAGFRDIEAGLPMPTPGTLPCAAADFDEDGDHDLLFLEPAIITLTRQVPVLYANDGHGGFTLLARGPVLTNAVRAGALDVDGDGRLEIWAQVAQVAGASRAQSLFLFRRNGGGLDRIGHVPLSEAAVISPVAWGDFNHDGSVDLLTLVTNSVSRGLLPVLYPNDGSGRFRPWEGVTFTMPRAPVESGLLLPGDFNGDGRLDCLQTIPRTNAFLLTNALTSLKPLPSPPPGRLQAHNFGTVVRFTWDEPPGLPAGLALTYNLRVGTRPGGNDVVPSQSLPDGRRLLPAPGNAGHSRQFWLRLPQAPAARLHWSVQAVDAAYRGGFFAAEQMLVLNWPDNAPPQISAIPDVTLEEDGTAEIEFTVTDDLTPPERLVAGAGAVNLQLFPSELHARVLTPEPGEPPALRRLRLVPWPDRWGESEVYVTVFDEAGLSSTRAVRVTVRPVADFPEPQLQPSRLGAYLGLGFRGDRHSVWHVEGSTNLVDWEVVSGGVVELGERTRWTVSLPMTEPHRFFRLRQIKP